MTRILSLALLASAASFAITPAAWAVSPSQEQCEAGGGTFTRTNGEVKCVTVEEGKNPKFTDTSTDTGQGNSGNKPASSDVCEPTGSQKCPPGQF
ncbi:hypothetical protein [Microvirga tunisiensis]|jgi:hypothetical protein|uniref:Uncharacterized protein n=1 Tax=Microvirga tunisiensis TaxID=2108360 RepID=A0A5N7MSI3_9HYPH|nr:hypothetical protein [Microvirga tunisiensis]MPR10892.1 hypothetical protein [Microvirga tunisiensis]MPR29064.1 hypothetical protein [Microvirga tunisiensis]